MGFADSEEGKSLLERLRNMQIEEYGHILTDEEADEIHAKKEEEEQKEKIAYKIHENLREYFREVPIRFEGANFDNYTISTEKQQKAVDWLKSGKSAVIYGANGIGKTHLAYASCLYQIEHGSTAGYVLAFDLFTEIKDSFKQGNTEAVIMKYAQYRYLVVDEIDKTYASETDFIYFFNIINKRYNNMFQTVLISNSANMIDISGKSSFDRVASDGAVINLDGDNFRHKH